MRFEPFLLDQWIERKFSANWNIVDDFTASSGPGWTVGELLDLAGRHADELRNVPVTYPSALGSTELRAAVADFEGVDPDVVQIVTGAEEALVVIFFNAAEAGANVVLPQPGFPAFTALARGFGLEVRHYHLRLENGFDIDPDEVCGLIDDRTSVLLVNSPHNPCGSVVTEDARRRLHDVCAERGVQFVCDQVFHPNYHGANVATAATLPQATVIGDFSKAMCLPGLRVGWIVERDRRRRERYTDSRMYFTIANSPITEWLAVQAMEHRDAIHARARDVSAANLRVIEKTWPVESEHAQWIRPGGGFTIFPRFRHERNTRTLCEHLGSRGILVAPGDCFDAPSHVRLGFGGPQQPFADGFVRFRTEVDAYFAEQRHRSTVATA